MADTLVQLSIETDLIADAAHSLMLAHKALSKRHGHKFRELEKLIEALAGQAGEPRIHQLDDGTVIIDMPQGWADILAEAKRLGLI